VEKVESVEIVNSQELMLLLVTVLMDIMNSNNNAINVLINVSLVLARKFVLLVLETELVHLIVIVQ
jgi:hypothetical protein